MLPRSLLALVAAALVALGGAGCAGEAGDEAEASEGALAKTWTGALVVGHRGAPYAAPENTIPALEAALAHGADALEIDVCLTGDGHFVLWNDPDPASIEAMKRQWGGETAGWVPVVPPRDDAPSSRYRRRVDRLSLAEFREHHGYKPAGWFKSRDPGIHIPTLPEVAAWARGKPVRALIVDVKLFADQAPLSERLIGEIARHFDGSRVDISLTSPHASVVAHMQRHVRERGLRMSVMRTVEASDRASVLSAMREVEVDGAMVADPRGAVDLSARRDGTTRVVATTVNEESDMNRLLDARVDAIVTDHPERLARVVRARGPR